MTLETSEVHDIILHHCSCHSLSLHFMVQSCIFSRIAHGFQELFVGDLVKISGVKADVSKADDL